MLEQLFSNSSKKDKYKLVKKRRKWIKKGSKFAYLTLKVCLILYYNCLTPNMWAFEAESIVNFLPLGELIILFISSVCAIIQRYPSDIVLISMFPRRFSML